MIEQVRVVVADDHPSIRAGLRAQLESHGDVLVVAEAATVPDAVAAVTDHAPDVLLVDHQMHGGHGLDVLRQLPAGDGTAVVLVTGYDDRALVAQYVNAGAAGFVHKSAGPVELHRCVTEAAAGRAALDPESLRRTLLAPTTPDPVAALSAREIDVLRGVTDGLTNDAIGSRLGISSQTVKTHLSRIFGKLGVADRAQAAVVATRRGWI